jgi:D-galactonate transporter
MNPGQTQHGGHAQYEAIFSKINWHLLPLLIVCYIISFLDRINIGFAQLQMKESLPFSDAAYAFGAGVFFIGYFLFEVPSNLMLEKIGARKTLLRIMFCWGLCAAGMMFVQTTTQFYVLRFLLGAFEAGFFPGIILYLTYWYPGPRRAKAIAVFMTGTTIAYLIAGPTSGFIMKFMDGWIGYRGWQWLFLVQGLPASVLGVIAFFYLKDKPEQAGWLTPGEKETLRNHLDNDAHAVATASHGSAWGLLRDPRVYTLSLVYLLSLGAIYTMVFWSPTLIKSWGVADVFLVGMLAAIPALFGIAGMVLIGRSSDQRLERRWHYAFTMMVAAVGLLITIVARGDLAMSLAGLCLVSIGHSAATPILFTAVSEYLPKKTAAGGIALISSLGNLGPAVMPSIAAWMTATTGSPVNTMYLVIVLHLVAGGLLLYVMRPVVSPRLATA